MYVFVYLYGKSSEHNICLVEHKSFANHIKCISVHVCSVISHINITYIIIQHACAHTCICMLSFHFILMVGHGLLSTHMLYATYMIIVHSYFRSVTS